MKTYLLLLGFILNFSISQAQLNFEEINPAKEGHRINAIAMPTENSGVTVGDFGTILFTTDGFTTWTIVETGTKKELFAVAFFTPTIGIAVGADGVLLRTTTAGASWQTTASGVRDSLRSIVVIGSRAIVVGGNGTILETNDQGLTWTTKPSGYPGNLNCIKFRGVDTGIIVGENGLILRTENSGLSWTKVSTDSSIYPSHYSFISSVDWVNDSTIIAIGYIGFNARSLDSGRTWEKYYTKLPSLAGGNFRSVHFINSLVGYIGGFFRTFANPAGSVLWTEDGGNTWKTQDNVSSLFTKNRISILPVIYDFLAVSPNKIYAVGLDFVENKTPLIIRSFDGGTNWDFSLNLNHGKIIEFVEDKKYARSSGYDDIAFIDDQIGFVAGYGGKIRRTDNGGDSWQDLPSGTQRRMRRLNVYDHNTVAAMADSGMVLLSNDGGITWKESYPMTDSSAYWGMGFRASAFSDSKTLWISDYNFHLPLPETGFILRTNDLGKTWTNIRIPGSDNDRYYSIVFKTPLQGWILGYRKMALETRIPLLLHTTDGGTTWEEQALPPFKSGEYLNPVMVFTDTLHGSIEIGGASTDSNTFQTYFHTTDGGKTWTRKEPYFRQSPAYSMNRGSLTDLTFSDSHHGVILATYSYIGQTSLHYTDNAGETWKFADYTFDSGYFDRGLYKLSYPTSKRCWVLGRPYRIFRLTLPETSSAEEKPSPQDGISISPNPTSTSFTISGIDNILLVKIMNSLGMEVSRKPLVVSGKQEVDVSDLVAGVYFVQVRTPAGITSKPVVITR